MNIQNQQAKKICINVLQKNPNIDSVASDGVNIKPFVEGKKIPSLKNSGLSYEEDDEFEAVEQHYIIDNSFWVLVYRK